MGMNECAGRTLIPGLLMVLTLKVTACALNYQDSLMPTSELNDFQKRRAVTQLPNVLDYAGWLMFPCTLVVGPAIEFRDYHDWLNKKGVWGGPKGCPSVWLKTLQTVGYALIFCAVHMYIMGIYTIDNTYLSPEWNSKPLWLKFWRGSGTGGGGRVPGLFHSRHHALSRLDSPAFLYLIFSPPPQPPTTRPVYCLLSTVYSRHMF